MLQRGVCAKLTRTWGSMRPSSQGLRIGRLSYIKSRDFKSYNNKTFTSSVSPVLFPLLPDAGSRYDEST